MPDKHMSRIAQIRQLRGLAQNEVARELGISRPTYSQIESGVKDLTVAQAKSLANILNIGFNDVTGESDGFLVFNDIGSNGKKYRQMILCSIKYGADSDGKITKTKLAKLVYLADFIWYYLKSSPMSGLAYKKMPQGPVPVDYFLALDELEENDKLIAREIKGSSHLFSLVESDVTFSLLSDDEVELITKICEGWKGKSTNEIVDFTHSQLPWLICRDNEIIPYVLITQEEPERVYGPVKI
jgi:transcriptional regulator with XRE-family HTH domain